MELDAPRKPGVARIVLGILAICPLSPAVGIMPFVIFVFGGGGWDAFVAQNGAALVVFPIIGVAVLVAGIVMIVTGVRNRRAWDRAHRPAWRA
ncbi:hypothetical protein ACWDR7_08740 [Microbacterium sp. NPDC003461]|jgi:hypothetical protein